MRVHDRGSVGGARARPDDAHPGAAPAERADRGQVV